ncbi:hypothetical protein Scep_003210 [Stephania cephalantha]|uniref:RING-type domain-containing protein n=1 Tax=Stephania cephalantha TaxID=152367 RepID=A0AAP0KQ30_9MAGN
MAAAPSPSEIHSSKSFFSRFHYALVIFGLAVVLIIILNVVFIKYCPQLDHNARRVLRRRRTYRETNGRIHGVSRYWHSIPSAVYMKDEVSEEANEECSVCLGVFEDGDDVRQLPHCKHYFHTPCIDMWLFSHSNCPLCRVNIARFGEPELDELRIDSRSPV